MRSRKSARAKRPARAKNAKRKMAHGRNSTRVEKATRVERVTRFERPARAAKSVDVEKAARVGEAADAEQSTRLWSALGAWALAVFVLSGALLMVGRPSTKRAGSATANPPGETAAAPLEPPEVAKPAPRTLASTKPATATASAANATPIAKTIESEKSDSGAPGTTTPHAAVPVSKTTLPADAIENAPATEQAAIGAVEGTALVTIAGCLDTDDDTFRLKNAAGADAPKARSWRSAFLKKRSASVAVVDTANRLGLANHVGQWVTLTGTLVDRELQVRSLQSVAASCDR